MTLQSTPPFCLPLEPVTFDWTVSVAWTGREPFRRVVLSLRPGDALVLRREPDNAFDPRAILVTTAAGAAAGYLYAAEAGLLFLLFDRYPPLADRSCVAEIIAPATSRQAPILRLQMILDLASAWPLFTLIAMLELKTERFPRHFDVQRNPWLDPLLAMHRQYQSHPDAFHLPWPIILAWMHLTGQATHPPGKPAASPDDGSFIQLPDASADPSGQRSGRIAT